MPEPNDTNAAGAGAGAKSPPAREGGSMDLLSFRLVHDLVACARDYLMHEPRWNKLYILADSLEWELRRELERIEALER